MRKKIHVAIVFNEPTVETSSGRKYITASGENVTTFGFKASNDGRADHAAVACNPDTLAAQIILAGCHDTFMPLCSGKIHKKAYGNQTHNILGAIPRNILHPRQRQ